MWEALAQDVRLAWRGFRRDRGATAVAIASLAIGIAANATIFSLIQAVEFPRMIYPAADRIVFLESGNRTRDLDRMPTSAPDALDIARSARTLEHASLTADQSSILTSGTSHGRLSGRRVAGGFFTVLQTAPALGRALSPADPPGAMVLGHETWQTWFGSDPAVIGLTVRLDGEPATIVGVMPRGFDRDADFWVPLGTSAADARRDDRQFTMFARLAPGAGLNEAARELGVISQRLALDHPDTNRDWLTTAVPLQRMHGRDSRGAFFMLQGAVGFVLLIVCANIANLQLARGTRRAREMALRLSLGATRARLLRQLLTESVCLALIGGTIGVWLAMWGIALARQLGGFPSVIEPSLNSSVVIFTAVISMATGIACGLLPALRASQTAPEAAMRGDGGRGSTTPRGHLRNGLVALQLAAAMVLVVCAALMTQTLEYRQRVALGFDPAHVTRASLTLDPGRHVDPAATRAAVDTLMATLRSDPAIVDAGVSSFALPTGAGAERVLTLPSVTSDPVVHRGGGVEAVTPGYFAAMGIPVRMGRGFANTDAFGTEPVAVINDELAAALWHTRNPIGETLRLGALNDATAPSVRIVGVVGSIRRSPMHDRIIARVYLPFAQYPDASMTITARGRSDDAATARAIHAAVRAVDPALLAENVLTADADLAEFVAPMRLIAVLLAAFGATGLLLAGLGVFGTMSYTISQREREIAVRAALGATAADLRRLVLGSALGIAAAGIIPGVLLARLAARALDSLLYGVTATDLRTYVGVAAFLTLTALAACYRPTRAAVTIDPIQVLRRD